MQGIKKWYFWIFLMSALQFSYSYRLYIETMKCGYGERGSLTATCTNVNVASFFKTTSYRFDHLDETLQCQNCSLKSIEPNTFDISGNQIKHLILKESQINELQQRAFVGLVFLNDLDLSSNNIQMINRGTFAGVKKIELINLRNNSLALLSDDGFSELGNLDTLILSENKISVIDMNAFNGLRKLKVLRLDHNRITNVSGIFNNLTNLENLDLSDNNIRNLKGKDFDNLTALYELKLDKNKITTIPSLEFFCMSNLASLGLSNNNINHFESRAFEGLDKLEILDLGDNQIVEIPEKTFRNLNSLYNINMTRNLMSIFRISRFAGLPKLRILDLSRNSIEDIDVTGIFPLHDLHSLDLSNNNLTDINYVSLLHRMPRISYLALQNNLWPCGLEDEMNDYFSGENFKFLLFDSKNGSVVCNDSIVRKKTSSKRVSVEEVYDNAITSVNSSTSSDIYIILSLIGLAFSVLCLSIGQYRIAKELRFNPLYTRRRTISEVKLFQSDLREDDNDYMK